jgi:hypothetical protein
MILEGSLFVWDLTLYMNAQLILYAASAALLAASLASSCFFSSSLALAASFSSCKGPWRQTFEAGRRGILAYTWP